MSHHSFDEYSGGEQVSSGGGGSFASFGRHMFSSSPQGKADLWNAAQYSVLAVAPLSALNRGINAWTPEPDDEASSLVLLAEILLQVIVLFLGFVFVHRLVSFVPTYSGFPYEKVNMGNVILTVTALMLSLKSKLGIKVNILVDRLGELFNGGSSQQDRGRGGPQQQRKPVVQQRAAAQPLPLRGPLSGVQPAGNMIR